jgi:serpin B
MERVREPRAAFGLPARLAAHQAWNAIDQAIAAAADADESTTVTIADRMWPRVDVTPDQAWIDLLAGEHGADSETLDFAGDPDGSRETINAWVDDQTEGRIPELLPPGFIKPETTVLVLADALYFAADWARPFGKYGPVTGAFTRLDGSTTTIEFIQELELADRRGVGDGYAAAEIPYAGNDFAMLVIVPDEGRFEEIRERLGHHFLDQIDSTFTTGPYELLLPKWDDASQIDLLRWLERLGAAPGSYPAITPEAFLGAAVHGADISVDEFGTVAAAATAVGFEESGPPEPELSVRADKPFFYVIRQRDSGLVLFAGQVTDPTA